MESEKLLRYSLSITFRSEFMKGEASNLTSQSNDVYRHFDFLSSYLHKTSQSIRMSNYKYIVSLLDFSGYAIFPQWTSWRSNYSNATSQHEFSSSKFRGNTIQSADTIYRTSFHTIHQRFCQRNLVLRQIIVSAIISREVRIVFLHGRWTSLQRVSPSKQLSRKTWFALENS